MWVKTDHSIRQEVSLTVFPISRCHTCNHSLARLSRHRCTSNTGPLGAWHRYAVVTDQTERRGILMPCRAVTTGGSYRSELRAPPRRGTRNLSQPCPRSNPKLRSAGNPQEGEEKGVPEYWGLEQALAARTQKLQRPRLRRQDPIPRSLERAPDLPVSHAAQCFLPFLLYLAGRKVALGCHGINAVACNGSMTAS